MAFSFTYQPGAEGRPMVFLSTDRGALASRRRFDAAHELAHLIAHGGCEVGDPALEDVADRFASAFLLPAAPFRSECPTRLSWPALRDLKRRWGVSLLAIVRRAYDLGIYSEATYRRAHVQYGQHGWRAQGEPDEPPMERPTLVQHVVAQLAEAGHPPAAVAAALRYGPACLRGRGVAGRPRRRRRVGRRPRRGARLTAIRRAPARRRELGARRTSPAAAGLEALVAVAVSSGAPPMCRAVRDAPLRRRGPTHGRAAPRAAVEPPERRPARAFAARRATAAAATVWGAVSRALARQSLPGRPSAGRWRSSPRPAAIPSAAGVARGRMRGGTGSRRSPGTS
jgi:hypothetical protein